MSHRDCPYCGCEEYGLVRTHCSENGWIEIVVCNSCGEEYEFYSTDEDGESIAE